MFRYHRPTHAALRVLLPAVALAFACFAVACAENPADGIAPAEVTDVSAPAEDAAQAAAEAVESGDIIPEGPGTAAGEEDSLEDVGYLEGAAATAEEAQPYDAPASGSGEADEVAALPTRVYVISPANSKIEFECSKVTRSHVGGFNTFSGEIQLPGETPEGASLNVTIQTDSVWTDTDQLTGHLKSPDFFDVATYPESRFVLTGVVPTETGYDLSGEFTLHGITKAITFPASVSVGETSVSATSEFVINRFDFGIEYPGAADDLIRSEVVIRLTINADAA